MPEVWAVIVTVILLMVIWGVIASKLKARKRKKAREKSLPYVEGNVVRHNMDNTLETIRIIENAFTNVRLDNGISLREARIIDDHGGSMKRGAARKKDELINWRDIADKDIEKYPDIFPFLDARGILFHVPAYMLYIIKYRDDEKSVNAKESVIYSLIPSKENDEWFVSRFALIEEGHRKAIVAFLKWMLAHTKDKYDEEEEIREALVYWSCA